MSADDLVTEAQLQEVVDRVLEAVTAQLTQTVTQAVNTGLADLQTEVWAALTDLAGQVNAALSAEHNHPLILQAAPSTRARRIERDAQGNITRLVDE